MVVSNNLTIPLCSTQHVQQNWTPVPHNLVILVAVVVTLNYNCNSLTMFLFSEIVFSFIGKIVNRFSCCFFFVLQKLMKTQFIIYWMLQRYCWEKLTLQLFHKQDEWRRSATVVQAVLHGYCGCTVLLLFMYGISQSERVWRTSVGRV